ncbi:MAG: hypothetical protein OEM93_20535 [Rhodospirillales bacterium]|nr:hypothetical protein [Rhodospirillales bacterium]MDH3920414.1 hypothetical protein [Rhodospirillales bacterium]
MRRYQLVFFVASLGLLAGPVSAAGFDGSKPLICASIEAFDCASGGDCLKGTAESMNVPQFIRLDFKGKVAKATRPDGEERISKFGNMTQNDGALILQGVQGGLGWSMTIAQDGGKMALTAAGEEVGFVIFGACTLL